MHSARWWCARRSCSFESWVMSYTVAIRWKRHRFDMRSSSPRARPTNGGGILASWCGMRGIVTLAAALALPDGSSAFPARDVIVFSAFCVVLSTLVLQGLTLRALMQWLGLRDDGSVEREIGSPASRLHGLPCTRSSEKARFRTKPTFCAVSTRLGYAPRSHVTQPVPRTRTTRVLQHFSGRRSRLNGKRSRISEPGT